MSHSASAENAPALDLEREAARIVDAVAGGGVAIIPLDVAYGIVGHTESAIRQIFTAKQRSYGKPSGMFGNWDLFTEIYPLGQRERDVVRAIILDHDLPFSIVAPFRPGAPHLAALDPFVLKTTTKNSTLDMLMNAGALHNEMTRLSRERQVAVVGSSANLSLAGAKYRLDDIEEPVRAAADLEIDGGLSKYHSDQGLSSTIVDLRNYKTVRVGHCYDAICDLLLKDFRIDLKSNGMA